ncbi:hypothetical protein F5B17DRAFT_436464 [Nemania serpens]|nr:hypothetical protein F5B17DRAFT_436464 [Nemania serpens]
MPDIVTTGLLFTTNSSYHLSLTDPMFDFYVENHQHNGAVAAKYRTGVDDRRLGTVEIEFLFESDGYDSASTLSIGDLRAQAVTQRYPAIARSEQYESFCETSARTPACASGKIRWISIIEIQFCLRALILFVSLAASNAEVSNSNHRALTRAVSVWTAAILLITDISHIDHIDPLRVLKCVMSSPSATFKQQSIKTVQGVTASINDGTHRYGMCQAS